MVSICVPACLSIYLSIIYLSIHPSTHPSIHPNPSIYRVLIRSSYSEIETSTAPTVLTQQTTNTWRNLAHPSDASPSRCRRSVFFSKQQRTRIFDRAGNEAQMLECIIVQSEKTYTLACVGAAAVRSAACRQQCRGAHLCMCPALPDGNAAGRKATYLWLIHFVVKGF